MVRTVIGRDQYGDWQCKYCGRYISDPRALHRREVNGYRVPVCTVCNMLLPLFGEERDFEYLQGRIVDLLNPLAHKRSVIRPDKGMVIDEFEHKYPHLDVFRVYVTERGRLVIRPRKGGRT